MGAHWQPVWGQMAGPGPGGGESPGGERAPGVGLTQRVEGGVDSAGGAHRGRSGQGALARVPEGWVGQCCVPRAPHLMSDVTKAWRGGVGGYSLQKGPVS